MKLNIAFIPDENAVTALLYTSSNDFIASAKFIDDKKHKVFQVMTAVGRPLSGTILYQSMAKYASMNGYHIVSEREGDTRERALKHWEAFDKGWYECSSIDLPDSLCTEMDEFTNKEESPFFYKGYSMKPDLMFLNSLVDINNKDNIDQINQILIDTQDFFGISYDLENSAWINEDFPIAEPDFYSGNNIITVKDRKKLEDTYYSGRCMYLAIALHERYGFELQASIVNFKGDESIGHVWNVLNDKQHIDILGPYDNAKEWQWGAGETKYRNMTVEQLMAFMYPPGVINDHVPIDEHEQRMADAHSVIDNYLLQYFEREILSNSKLASNKAPVTLINSTKLPFKILTKDTLIHVGTMCTADKKDNSYEGDGVSVSVNPNEWRRIAKLSGKDFVFKKQGSQFAEFHSMDKRKLFDWGVKSKLVEKATLYRVEYYDDEIEEDLYTDYIDKSDAQKEIDCMGDPDIVIQDVESHVPTDKIKAILVVKTDNMTVDRHLFGLYIQENFPDIDGVWFEDKLDVLSYSAPAGMIFKEKVNSWSINEFVRENTYQYALEV